MYSCTQNWLLTDENTKKISPFIARQWKFMFAVQWQKQQT